MSVAEMAARWVVNMESGPERQRLWDGHHARRIDTMENGYRATDHSQADAWLVSEWQAATTQQVAA